MPYTCTYLFFLFLLFSQHLDIVIHFVSSINLFGTIEVVLTGVYDWNVVNIDLYMKK